MKIEEKVDALTDTIDKWLGISDTLDPSIRTYCKIKGVNRQKSGKHTPTHAELQALSALIYYQEFLKERKVFHS